MSIGDLLMPMDFRAQEIMRSLRALEDLETRVRLLEEKATGIEAVQRSRVDQAHAGDPPPRSISFGLLDEDSMRWLTTILAASDVFYKAWASSVNPDGSPNGWTVYIYGSEDK